MAPQSGQHLGSDNGLPQLEPRAVDPPVRLPEMDRPTIPEVDPATDRDSLFDTLSDPFGDDARVRTYRRVRPTSYEQEVLRPIRRVPLPVN